MRQAAHPARPAPARGGALGRALATSAALHLAAVLALRLVPPQTPPPPAEQPVVVEILAEPEAAEAEESPSPSLPAPSPPGPLPAAPPESGEPPPGDGMVRATELLAARTLAAPGSRQALAALRQLFPDERIVQLCNLEAMEQVRHHHPDFRPDFVVAYASADTVLSGRTLEADGAAIRSRGTWYAIRFECEVAADLESVAAFAFELGAEIPESEWEAYTLPAGDGTADD